MLKQITKLLHAKEHYNCAIDLSVAGFIPPSV
jgi:hypothetical protein